MVRVVVATVAWRKEEECGCSVPGYGCFLFFFSFVDLFVRAA